MDYSYYLKKYTLDEAKLINYGFTHEGQWFVLKVELKQNGLYAVIKISTDTIGVRVIDSAFDDDFLPFGIKNSQCPEKHEVERILEDIVKNCFTNIDIKSILTQYLFEKYGTVHEQPWEKFPNYCTFKTRNSKKWYAIIMDIKQSCIGLDGENIVDVINVKLDPDKISALIDYKHYYPSYHMSKKTWITILLNKTTNLNDVKNLIDESYNLTEKSKK